MSKKKKEKVEIINKLGDSLVCLLTFEPHSLWFILLLRFQLNHMTFQVGSSYTVNSEIIYLSYLH